MHGGQHLRAVGALLAPRLDQAACLEALQHPVQQEVLRPLSDEAGAELRKHAEVKARVGQLEAERILPVIARAHGIGSLPVARVLQELEHRDQRQPPRRKAGLTPGRVELAEVLVLVKGAELVAQPRDHGALGKRRTGNTRSLGRNFTNQLRM